MKQSLMTLIVLLYTCSTYAGERPKADINCVPVEQKFTYDCQIILQGKKSGTSIDNAKLIIGAEMPSMPMAHNVKPVTADQSNQTGHYKAQIELEMYGEWLLRIDVSGPTRDRIIQKMYFAKDKVSDIP